MNHTPAPYAWVPVPYNPAFDAKIPADWSLVPTPAEAEKARAIAALNPKPKQGGAA